MIKRVLKFLKKYIPYWSLGERACNSVLEFPSYISVPENIIIEQDVRFRFGCKILNSSKDTIRIKRYSVIGNNCTIITNKHISTVGIPQILLGISGINDQNISLTIEEDVWVGSNVTIMGVEKIGRGAICGACCTITKNVPPYAIVVGSPAKIVGVKFDVDEIIEHEKILYPIEERLTREELDLLFQTYYTGKKVFGISRKLTDVEMKKVSSAIKSRNFSDPSIINRLYNK